MVLKSNLKNHSIAIEQSQNQDFFEILYNLYYQKLYLFAFSYTSSKEDAEEIVHDVFLKLWKKQDELSSISNLTGYIYKMTRNGCLDFLRAKKNILAIESNMLQQQNLLNLHALSDDPSSAIIEKELEAQIIREINKLPEKCRMVFIKSRLEGLQHKEIAHDMKISTKTIENHISKALKKIKGLL
ncbi:RNA polymerase sigma-70 factor [Zobellia uliginosa]|uniref:RNA polymerase sigma-70 factor n=1 Tax=Zobellia uliginosa TaxID=143224 RepID=UPI0026E207BC|nr:RNA polymerase sigma-70 factor [Zobellia uliginosa]MDO6518620.1 RNA polymerase sigma-70 factor [Zobellia uliginosa]